METLLAMEFFNLEVAYKNLDFRNAVARVASQMAARTVNGYYEWINSVSPLRRKFILD
jgi:hypothetical protein